MGGFANLAHYYAEAGQSNRAITAVQHSEAMLDMAAKLSSGEILASTPSLLVDTLEGWRYKQVKAKIYETHYRLGRPISPFSLAEQDFDEGLSTALRVEAA